MNGQMSNQPDRNPDDQLDAYLRKLPNVAVSSNFTARVMQQIEREAGGPQHSRAFMSDLTQTRWLPIVLLTCSNLFMTVAWYGHLKFKSSPIWIVILVSWGIAFFEYCLQVPANRWGNSVYTATQLKIIQEIVTLSVFCIFAAVYLHEKIRWNHLAAFGCVLGAVAFTFLPKH